jgi:phosphatidylcholine synthase
MRTNLGEQAHGFSSGQRAAAWAVHCFTASGGAVGFWALIAVLDGDIQTAWLMLGLAFVIDGFDGALARRARVKEVLPRFNGVILDGIVDYLNYVTVPAVMVYALGLLPGPLLIAGGIFIMLSSIPAFCSLDVHTPDNYFVGFSAIWNVVVLYFYLFATDPLLNAAVVLVLGILTFSQIKVVHPVRVKKWRPLTLVVMAGWAASSILMVVTHPDHPAWAALLLLASTLYFIAISLRRTARGGEEE